MGTTNILDINNRISALEKGGGGIDLKAYTKKVDIAPEFSDATNYNVGYLVYYDGLLYEFQLDHTAGVWEQSEVQQKDLSDILNNIPAERISYDNTDSGLSATDVQGAVDELANFKTATLTNTTYLYSNGAAIKHGYTVTLTFSGFKGLTNHETTTLSGLVPQGMRPQNTVKCPIISPSTSSITASEIYRIKVQSTGDVDIYPYNGVATQNNLEFSLTYVV